MAAPRSVDPAELSPLAWRLLRVAAGYEQRAVEREVDDIIQAHISMLESGSRALSLSRRRDLFELYTAELTPEQVTAIAENF
jgi:plasmid stability protein